MTYDDLDTIIKSLNIGCPSVAIAWQKKSVPAVYARYYMVSVDPEGHYNDVNTKTKYRISIDVYDKSGLKFEEIFKKIKTGLEGSEGFKKMFGIGDGRDPETGHFYKQGDIYYYEGE